MTKSHVGSDQFVQVDTAAGTVRGRWRPTFGAGTNARSAAFLGIPFAEPPVGSMRFQAPVPKAPWRGVLDALDFGATAQRGDPGVTLIPEPSVAGDATLNVNVFTPAPGDTDAALPVLVWIHGGGYSAGSPASPWYDGRSFNRDAIVTVTISYRLGFDGFGWIDGAPTNRAVRDWLLALEWVQENIAQFGGDPAKVTIAGQSAGGGSVLTLLGMESAQHLFARVFALSSPIPDVSEERARAFAADIANGLGVPNNLEGFRSVSEDQVLAEQKRAFDRAMRRRGKLLAEGLPLGPTVDGDLIPRRTISSLESGVGADKPLVMGVTDDEFAMVLVDAQEKLRWVPKSILLAQMGVPKAKRNDYLDANRELVELPRYRLAGRVVTDRMFKVNLLRIAEKRAAAPTWVYRFAWPSGAFGFAEHCLDVPFFFDCLDAPAVEALAGANPPQVIADELHADAVNYVRSGDPGWPRFGPPKYVVRVFDLPTRDVPDGLESVYPLLEATV